MKNPESKIISNEEELCATLKTLNGNRIVTTNGCFDILHWGHMHMLYQSRLLGDVLICCVNSDKSVQTLNKGSNRPIHKEHIRLLQLASLESVDYVVLFYDSTPTSILDIIRPHIHTKGGDYIGKDLEEENVVSSHGGSIVYIPYVDGFSTTHILTRLPTISKK